MHPRTPLAIALVVLALSALPTRAWAQSAPRDTESTASAPSSAMPTVSLAPVNLAPRTPRRHRSAGWSAPVYVVGGLTITAAALGALLVAVAEAFTVLGCVTVAVHGYSGSCGGSNFSDEWAAVNALAVAGVGGLVTGIVLNGLLVRRDRTYVRPRVGLQLAPTTGGLSAGVSVRF